jgi:hypothetical protein
MNNKLPLHTRLGSYAAAMIMVVLCFLMLHNCVNAVYYGAVTSDKKVDDFYNVGFVDGSNQSGTMDGLSEENTRNPLLVKMYQEGFRDGRDSRKNFLKREKNEKE